MRVLRAIAIATLVGVPATIPSANCAYAQGRSPSSIQRRVDQLNRQGEEYEREQLNEDLKGKPSQPKDRRREQTLAAELQQDFKHLQENYNTIVLAMEAKTGFSYESISDSIIEINKCSTRLRQNLALPQPEVKTEKGKQPDPGLQTKELLMSLRKHIYSFVTNRLFESHGVLDLEQAKAASNDLDRIIDLSKTIKRNQERPNEDGAPPVNKGKPE